MSAEDDLKELEPRERSTVMSLVQDAGVDVSAWTRRKDGSRCLVPAANPQYCYGWCFGGGDEPTVLSVWFEDMSVAEGRIWYISQSAYRFDPQVGGPRRIRRAQEFDEMLQLAFEKASPVRVIVVNGTSTPHNEQKVKFRRLDPLSWKVLQFDAKGGRFVLERSSRG